jgi:hypothetical protein
MCPDSSPEPPTARPLAAPPLADNVEDGMTLILLRRARQHYLMQMFSLFKSKYKWCNSKFKHILSSS